MNSKLRIPLCWKVDLGIAEKPANAVRTALNQVSPPSEPASRPAAPTAPPTAAPGEPPPAPHQPADLTRPHDPTVVQLPSGELVVRARSVHFVTLAFDKAGWHYAKLLAWLGSLTELVGGALILIGLFSRIWALGLACVMGVAFYFTSLDVVMNLGLFNLEGDQFHRLYFQVAMFTLAFGVLLTGPGPVSLDRAIFRPAIREEAVVVERVNAPIR